MASEEGEEVFCVIGEKSFDVGFEVTLGDFAVVSAASSFALHFGEKTPVSLAIGSREFRKMLRI